MYWVQRLEAGPQRVNHAAVAVGNAIYTFGGYCSEEPLSDIIDTYIFNTVTLKWYRILPSDDVFDHYPAGIYGHSVVAYQNKIYLWGGINRLNQGTSQLFCFDVATLSWCSVETTGHVPKATDGHSACVIDNCMYVFGGFESDSEVLMNMLYKLDLDLLTWERVWTKGTPPSSRDFHTASAIGTRMYVFGGRSYQNQEEMEEIYNSEMMYFDTTNSTWYTPTVYGVEPRGRRSHSAAVYKGEIYIIGGCRPDYAIELEHLNDVHKFNPEKNCWLELSTKGRAPCPRRRHCSVVIEDFLYLFGGSSPFVSHGRRLGPHYIEHPEVFPPRLKEESDMFMMDLCPTLKRLSELKVAEYGFKLDFLPREVKNEIISLKQTRTDIIYLTVSEILQLRSADFNF